MPLRYYSIMTIYIVLHVADDGCVAMSCCHLTAVSLSLLLYVGLALVMKNHFFGKQRKT